MKKSKTFVDDGQFPEYFNIFYSVGRRDNNFSKSIGVNLEKYFWRGLS